MRRLTYAILILLATVTTGCVSTLTWTLTVHPQAGGS